MWICQMPAPVSDLGCTEIVVRATLLLPADTSWAVLQMALGLILRKNLSWLSLVHTSASECHEI